MIRYARIHGTKHRPGLTALLARKPTKVAAIALANKIARMAWAMMEERALYRTRRPCGVNEVATVTRRDVEGWESEQDECRAGRFGDRSSSIVPVPHRPRALTGSRSRGGRCG